VFSVKDKPVFGAHIGLQDTTPQAALGVAAAADRLGFGWVSVWDHFYSASPRDSGSLDAVVMHAALASVTSHARCGVLVYSSSYRHPAVLAKAAATVDLLSGGRADLGLGAGWYEREYNAYGIPFLTTRDRMDVLVEAAQCVRKLLREEESTFNGKYFSLNNARCDPRPIQPRLPIWIGGQGERRTLRIVAEFADGWNAPFVSPEVFAHKRQVLHAHCNDIGRDHAEIRCAANVGIGIDDADLDHHFFTINDTTHRTAGAVVTGQGQELIDQIACYIEAGADQVNFTWRAPFGLAAMETIAEAIRSW
jgi:F420-dependent oxidoreductase-like protein